METTPYYFYDLNLLNITLNEVEKQIASSSFKIHYAIKANNNKKIMSFISGRGYGADCVSGGEIMWALESGFLPEEIVYAGVGKTDDELEYALLNNIGMIHCESLEEILVINEIAQRLDTDVKIALRLNPNVNPLTHEKISTGLEENKFGLTTLEFDELLNCVDDLDRINIVGLHFHIGSQIHDMSVFVELCDKINQIVPNFESKIGPMSYLNVGGGLGIDYFNPNENPIPDFKSYFEVFKNCLEIDIPVHFELGRSIVGQCGSLRTKVLYIKKSAHKNFAVLDAGMTELLRPALYNAFHQIEKLYPNENQDEFQYDIVGPICESSDCFGKDISLPILKRGDILTIRSCGAYAESMSLRYNGREKIRSEVQYESPNMKIIQSA